MNNHSIYEYDCCDLHETTFLQGSDCPECIREIQEQLDDYYHAYADLVYENQSLVDNGNVYWLTIEQDELGRFYFDIIQREDTVEQSIPF